MLTGQGGLRYRVGDTRFAHAKVLRRGPIQMPRGAESGHVADDRLHARDAADRAIGMAPKELSAGAGADDRNATEGSASADRR